MKTRPESVPNRLIGKPFLSPRMVRLLVFAAAVGVVGFAAGILVAFSGFFRLLTGRVENPGVGANDQAVLQMLDAMATDTAGQTPEQEAQLTPVVVTYAEGLDTQGASLRLYGVGEDGAGRVVFPFADPAHPQEMGGDFTIEFWMKTYFGVNGTHACSNQAGDWMDSNVILSLGGRGPGDHDPIGIGLANGRIAFGVSNPAGGATLCGEQDVADGIWHHIAVTRASTSGELRLFVDGAPDGQANGPIGDSSYRDVRTGDHLRAPFLVLGAEKPAGGEAFASYSGWIDEIRVSTGRMYSDPFVAPNLPFLADTSTVGLYHLDEAGGAVVGDASSAPGGPNPGWCSPGGSPPGPEWWSDTPFDPPATPLPLGLCEWESGVYLPVITR